MKWPWQHDHPEPRLDFSDRLERLAVEVTNVARLVRVIAEDLQREEDDRDQRGA